MKKRIATVALITLLAASVTPAIGFDTLFRKLFRQNGDTVELKGGRSLSVGTTVSVEDTEYVVWERMDSNGDVVASMTVVCSDLTDGSQDCNVKLYTMVAGVLTLDTTFDGP